MKAYSKSQLYRYLIYFCHIWHHTWSWYLDAGSLVTVRCSYVIQPKLKIISIKTMIIKPFSSMNQDLAWEKWGYSFHYFFLTVMALKYVNKLKVDYTDNINHVSVTWPDGKWWPIYTPYKGFDVDLWNMEHQTMLTFYFSAMIYLSFKLITNDTKKHQTNYPKLFSEWTSSYFLRFMPETIMQILTNMQNNTLLVMDFLYRRAVLYMCKNSYTVYKNTTCKIHGASMLMYKWASLETLYLDRKK